METIFDYSPTEKELQTLGIVENRDEYSAMHSSNIILRHLCSLFVKRKQYNRAKLYLAKISDINMVYDYYRLLSHSPEGLQALKKLG